MQAGPSLVTVEGDRGDPTPIWVRCMTAVVYVCVYVCMFTAFIKPVGFQGLRNQLVVPD